MEDIGVEVRPINEASRITGDEHSRLEVAVTEPFANQIRRIGILRIRSLPVLWRETGGDLVAKSLVLGLACQRTGAIGLGYDVTAMIGMGIRRRKSSAVILNRVKDAAYTSAVVAPADIFHVQRGIGSCNGIFLHAGPTAENNLGGHALCLRFVAQDAPCTIIVAVGVSPSASCRAFDQSDEPILKVVAVAVGTVIGASGDRSIDTVAIKVVAKADVARAVVVTGELVEDVVVVINRSRAGSRDGLGEPIVGIVVGIVRGGIGCGAADCLLGKPVNGVVGVRRCAVAEEAGGGNFPRR